MEKLVSVIMPVYKVEESLLRKSIASVLKQTYSHLEFLVIDDGSPDKSGIICDEYTEMDERMRVFHTKNQGVSMARNVGLDHARGDYILFVDADDFMELNAIELLVEAMENYKPDVVLSAHHRITVDEERYPDLVVSEHKSKSLSQKEAIQHLCYMREPFPNYDFSVVWGCLYKKEVIGDLRFDPDVRIGEDFMFKYHVFLRCGKIMCLKDRLYGYLLRPDSAMRNSFNPAYYPSVIRLKEMFWNNAIPFYREPLRCRICNILVVLLFMIPIKKEYRQYRDPIIAFLKENRRAVLKNPHARKKVKIFMLLSYLGFDTTQKLFQMIKR